MNSGDNNIRDGVYSPHDRSYHLGRDYRETTDYTVLASAVGNTGALEVRWRKSVHRGQKGQPGRAEKHSQVCCIEPIRTV